MRELDSLKPGLPIVDAGADARFRSVALRVGLNPDDLWVGRYVDFEFNRSRHIFTSPLADVDGKRVLELGCNVGATAIILAHLGARVVAVDVEPAYVELTRLNAERYGMSPRVDAAFLSDAARMPFRARSFDMVTCNSVLEYVPYDRLDAILGELDRVLAPGGSVAILGTSNRIWPRERHSRKWGINYVPRAIDRVLLGRERRRGVTAWRLRRAFRGYDDLSLGDTGRALLEARTAMGLAGAESRILSIAARAARLVGVSIGMLLPSIVLVLRKPRAHDVEPTLSREAMNGARAS